VESEPTHCMYVWLCMVVDGCVWLCMVVDGWVGVGVGKRVKYEYE